MYTYAALNDGTDTFADFVRIERIDAARSDLLEHMAAGVKALQGAAATLDQLRGNTIDDVEFVAGRDGCDVAAFLDNSIRYARAAYCVVHTVIDKEAP
ncbi:MAG: hypothetical protein K2Q25_15720 [Mycobacteriaceae bacterium]|nr:hypothetical protein [Mycobacteriaceae bacterium]